ncbi:WbqC family protein [soil metagenome]
MTRTVVVTQSNYIPWRGYFDMIRQADELILLDSVQYTRRDWRNRNMIRAEAGPTWLTIPVSGAGRPEQSIDEVRPVDSGWSVSHAKTIARHYRKARAYDAVAPWLFDQMAEAAALPFLSDSNEYLLQGIFGRLGISTPMRRCTEVLDRDDLRRMDASARLARLCAAVGGDRYLTGPAAAGYLDAKAFEDLGIEIVWMSYNGYRPYPQCWPGFEPKVSIVDLLLNCGDGAAEFLGR